MDSKSRNKDKKELDKDNIDEELFIQLKDMYNNNYINPEEFKQIIIKYKEIKNEVKWFEEHEWLLAEMAEKSQVYSWLHRRSYEYYIKQDNLFVYPIAIINGLSSIFTLVGVTYSEDLDPKMLAVISGSINLMTGIMTGIYKKMNYNSVIEAHRQSSEKFTKLNRNISNQLSLRKEERETMPKYLKTKIQLYDEMVESSPMISKIIIKQFNHNFRNSGVSKPFETTGINKCNIYRESPEAINYKYELEKAVTELEPKPDKIDILIDDITETTDIGKEDEDEGDKGDKGDN